MSRCKARPAYKLEVQVLSQVRHCGGDIAIANTAIGAEGYLLLTSLSGDGYPLDGLICHKGSLTGLVKICKSLTNLVDARVIEEEQWELLANTLLL